SATKHAVYGLADAVDLELRNEPVDITVILPTVVNTDLTRGVTGKTRGVATLEPQDVATAIVGAITRPRFAVYVPASLGLTFAISAAIPRRWRNVIGRLTKSDRVLTEVDTQTREQYEREAFAEKDRVS
ncbi:MAG TPA: short-chain dehydrogenase, partial [Solirubrobacterales bacterium]|nr:short-chain dehydrogenase [Solirubrobacterales bacterium]